MLVSIDNKLNVWLVFVFGYVYVDWGVLFEMFYVKCFGDLFKLVLYINMGVIVLDYLLCFEGVVYLLYSVLD